jgi:hypothetical protein
MSKVRAEFIGLIIISRGPAAELLPGGAAGIQLEADGTRLVLIMCRLLKTSAQEILFEEFCSRNSVEEFCSRNPVEEFCSRNSVQEFCSRINSSSSSSSSSS